MRYAPILSAFLVSIRIMATAAQAQRTKTRSGAADMDLGEYKGIRHAIGVTEFENQAGWRIGVKEWWSNGGAWGEPVSSRTVLRILRAG